jgi:hypothetical protein
MEASIARGAVHADAIVPMTAVSSAHHKRAGIESAWKKQEDQRCEFSTFLFFVTVPAREDFRRITPVRLLLRTRANSIAAWISGNGPLERSCDQTRLPAGFDRESPANLYDRKEIRRRFISLSIISL